MTLIHDFPALQRIFITAGATCAGKRQHRGAGWVPPIEQYQNFLILILRLP
jgi:hypothetical protein